MGSGVPRTEDLYLPSACGRDLGGKPKKPPPPHNSMAFRMGYVSISAVKCRSAVPPSVDIVIGRQAMGLCPW